MEFVTTQRGARSPPTEASSIQLTEDVMMAKYTGDARTEASVIGSSPRMIS